MARTFRILAAVAALLLAVPASDAFADVGGFFDAVVDLFKPIFMELHMQRSPISRHEGDPAFGIAAVPVTPEMARKLKLKHRAGLYVQGVVMDTPAFKMGILQGDVVLSLDNRPLANLTDLHDAVAASRDEFTTATLWRNGGEITLELSAARYLVHN